MHVLFLNVGFMLKMFQVGRAFYLIQSGVASVIVADCDGKDICERHLVV